MTSGDDASPRTLAPIVRAWPLTTEQMLASEKFPRPVSVLLLDGKTGTGKSELAYRIAVSESQRPGGLTPVFLSLGSLIDRDDLPPIPFRHLRCCSWLTLPRAQSYRAESLEGRSFDHSLLILDPCHLFTAEGLRVALSTLGDGSALIACGDSSWDFATPWRQLLAAARLRDHPGIQVRSLSEPLRSSVLPDLLELVA